VRRHQCLTDLENDLSRPWPSESALSREELVKTLADKQFHRYIGPAIGRRTCVVDLDYMRVMHTRRDLGLAAKALVEGLLVTMLRKQEFNRTLAPEPQMLGFVHDAHPTLA